VQPVYFHAINFDWARVIPGGMDKSTLSESDICDLFIAPAVERVGWDNPLDPHYIVYVKDDGSARLGFGQPKPTREA
jgi:hypothetical protein